MQNEPILDLTPDDLVNIVNLCQLGITTHGRRNGASKVLDALADKIEAYLEAMAKRAQGEQPPAVDPEAAVASALDKRSAAAKADKPKSRRKKQPVAAS